MKITYNYENLVISLPVAQLKQLEQIIMNRSVKNWLPPLTNQFGRDDVVLFMWYDKEKNDGCKVWLQMDFEKGRFIVRNIMHPWVSLISEEEYNRYQERFKQDIIDPALKEIFDQKEETHA